MAKRRTRSSLPALVERLIISCKKALDDKTLKVTVADLIRMRDFKKELYPMELATRKVTWLDPWD